MKSSRVSQIIAELLEGSVIPFPTRSKPPEESKSVVSYFAAMKNPTDKKVRIHWYEVLTDDSAEFVPGAVPGTKTDVFLTSDHRNDLDIPSIFVEIKIISDKSYHKRPGSTHVFTTYKPVIYAFQQPPEGFEETAKLLKSWSPHIESRGLSYLDLKNTSKWKKLSSNVTSLWA